MKRRTGHDLSYGKFILFYIIFSEYWREDKLDGTITDGRARIYDIWKYLHDTIYRNDLSHAIWLMVHKTRERYWKKNWDAEDILLDYHQEERNHLS